MTSAAATPQQAIFPIATFLTSLKKIEINYIEINACLGNTSKVLNHGLHRVHEHRYCHQGREGAPGQGCFLSNVVGRQTKQGSTHRERSVGKRTEDPAMVSLAPSCLYCSQTINMEDISALGVSMRRGASMLCVNVRSHTRSSWASSLKLQ